MSTKSMAAMLTGLLIGLGLSQLAAPFPVRSQESKAQKAPVQNKELAVLKENAAAFEKAYNSRDAKSIAAQFTENAQVVDEDGQSIEGRSNIEARFANVFKEFPKAKISIEISDLRQLSNEVAVEDGFSTASLSPDEPGIRSPYTAVHVKRDGKWLIASVRDFPAEIAEATAHENLSQLEWLVGHWFDESHEGRVETKCQWSEDGNYLIQEYAIKSSRGAVLKGTQRLAWDPQRRVIRSWAFDQSGAFTEATWTPVEGAWIMKVQGVTPDGNGVSATRIITPIDNDSFHIDSSGIVVGNELMPDSSVRVVRQPPAPAN